MERSEYELTRRGFFQVGGAAVVSLGVASVVTPNVEASAQLEEAIARLEYLTPLDRAFIVNDDLVASGDKILERVDSRGGAVHVAYFGA